MNSLLDSTSPEMATSARGKRQPPPPPNRKTLKSPLIDNHLSKTHDFQTTGQGFTGPDEAISAKPVFRRFGSSDNILDIGNQRYEATASSGRSPPQTRFGGGRNGTQNDATSSGKNIDWKQMEASKIAPSPPSAHVNASVPRMHSSKHPLESQQVNADDDDDFEDLPPPPDPSQLYFADSKQSDLVVYGSLPPPPQFNPGTTNLKPGPAADKPNTVYDSATNMRATADILLKKLQSKNHFKLPNDDVFGRNGSPPRPSFEPTPPPGPAHHDQQVNTTAAANGRKKPPPPPPKLAGRQQSEEYPSVLNLAAIIADQASRRQDN